MKLINRFFTWLLFFAVPVCFALAKPVNFPILLPCNYDATTEYANTGKIVCVFGFLRFSNSTLYPNKKASESEVVSDEKDSILLFDSPSRFYSAHKDGYYFVIGKLSENENGVHFERWYGILKHFTSDFNRRLQELIETLENGS